MKLFISDKANSKNDEPEITATNSYIELEIPCDDKSSMFCYIIPRGKHSAFIAICLDDMFDSLIEDLDEDKYETLCDTWPTLARMLQNGIKDKYKDGALIKLEDSDYGDNKWFVASIAGNISFESAEELFCERTKETIGIVIGSTNALLSELNSRSPSMLKSFGKGVLKGIGYTALGIIAGTLGINIDDLKA